MPDLKAIQREIRERLSEVERLLEPLRIEREQLQKMLDSSPARATETAPRKATARSRSATAPRRPRGGGGSHAQQALARIAALRAV